MRLRGLCVAAAAAGLFVGAQPALAAGPVTFTDATGDARGGTPDITTVVVSNDDSGVIRIRVNLANADDRLARDARIYLYVDSDLNPATGAPDALGADHVFLLDGASQRFAVGHWDTTTPTFIYSPSQTVRLTYWSGFNIHVNRSELGVTTGFKFWLEAQKTTVTTTLVDDAAKAAGWGYTLQTGTSNPPDIQQMLAMLRPGTPHAKAVMSVRVTGISVEGASQLVRPDRWSCSATLGKQTFRGSGAHRCIFRLPASARRKKLTIRLTVAYRGEVVSASRSFVVR
jgi:hypothetical protein